MTVRRIQGYSDDAPTLAKQVGELARDVRDALRVEVVGPFVHRGTIRLPFGLDVGGRKPLLLLASYTDQDVEQSTEPTWSWVNGQARVTSLSHAPAATVSVVLTFFSIREAAA